jgi:hypothetical protein
MRGRERAAEVQSELGMEKREEGGILTSTGCKREKHEGTMREANTTHHTADLPISCFFHFPGVIKNLQASARKD